MINFILIGMTAFVLALGSVSADAKGVKKIVGTFDGECSFSLPNMPKAPCQPGVIWVIEVGGMASITFGYEGKNGKKATFGLIGSGDRQPRPEDYFQSINILKTSWGGKNMEDLSVEGECHFKMNPKDPNVNSISCLLYNRSAKIQFSFDLNNIHSQEIKKF